MFVVVRVTIRAEGSATGVGRLGSVVPPVGGKRREVVRAGEGGLGRDRLLLEGTSPSNGITLHSSRRRME
jgi:hypothetical protein